MTETAQRISGYHELDDSKMSYWSESGTWMLYLPGCGLGNLRNHTVVEHEDGSISVQPSILVTGHFKGHPLTRHGYLTAGVWKECES